ncbi:hypothetical protein AZ54_19535 [Xanthomonas oryzae pv. oryzae PXO86]|nr:hypothetical protein AZ54_19535 [Xanthomonas oryzae pv. oryzae PXO86]
MRVAGCGRPSDHLPAMELPSPLRQAIPIAIA